MTEEHRRLAAIMLTDIVGYTTLSQKNERLALELLEDQRTEGDCPNLCHEALLHTFNLDL